MPVNPRVQRWAEGRDLEADFGYGTTVEDISFCAHHLDTCECVREFAWSKKAPEDDRREVAVTSIHICQRHEHMWVHGADHHHSEIVAENKHKNIAHAELVAALPTRHKHELTDESGAVIGHAPKKAIPFFYVENELHFDLDHIPEVDRVRVQEAFDRKFHSRRTFVKRNPKKG